MATLNPLYSVNRRNSKFDKNIFKAAYISMAIKLIIESYRQVVNDKALKGEHPKENTRRNCLIHYMNKNNEKSKAFFSINSECETYDQKTFQSLGRIDIKLAISYNCDHYYSFECKRLLKTTSGNKKIEREYINDGLQRYIELKYSSKMNVAGMIAFVESGDIIKIAPRIKTAVQAVATSGTTVKDISDTYLHKYVYSSTHTRNDNTNIDISHIVLDFTLDSM